MRYLQKYADRPGEIISMTTAQNVSNYMLDKLFIKFPSLDDPKYRSYLSATSYMIAVKTHSESCIFVRDFIDSLFFTVSELSRHDKRKEAIHVLKKMESEFLKAIDWDVNPNTS